MAGSPRPRKDLHEATLVHYDIRASRSVQRAALHRFLVGRVDVKATGEGPKRYRYPGLLSRGGERIGQSVLLLEPDLADRLIAELQALGIRYWTRDVYVE